VVGHWDWCPPPHPTKSAARGGSRSRDWGQYRLIWRAQSTSLYNGDLGAVSPAGFRDRARGQGIRGQSPLKLNTFLCCDMPEIVQSCYVYEQGRQSRRIIGGHKRRLEVWGMEVLQRGPGAEPW